MLSQLVLSFCRISDDMKLTDLELVRLANNIQELLYNASDVCHDRSVKFLMARAKVRSLGQTAVVPHAW